jgi:type II secretory pathway component PulF
MYAVGLCAFLVWLAIVAGVWLLTGALILLIAGSIGAVVVLVRRAATQQESLLWSLSVAADRSMPLAPAVLAFADQYGRSFRWRAQLLASLLNEGTSLPDALDRVPRLLSRDAEVLVRTGWSSGTLARSLREAAASRSLRQAAWGSAAARFAYLGWVLLTMQTVIGFILFFITPKFEAIFRDFGVPLPEVTILSIDIGHMFIRWGWLTLPLVLFEVACLVVLPFALLNVFLWDIPLFDSLLRRRHTTLVLRALGLTVGGRRPIGEGIEALSREYPSEWVRKRLRRVNEDVRQGRDWIESLADRSLIGPADAAVLEAAARVGNLEWALREMADANERRLGYWLQFWLQMLFPFLVLVLGVVAFFFAVAYFAPLVRLLEVLAR